MHKLDVVPLAVDGSANVNSHDTAAPASAKCKPNKIRRPHLRDSSNTMKYPIMLNVETNENILAIAIKIRETVISLFVDASSHWALVISSSIMKYTTLTMTTFHIWIWGYIWLHF